MLYDCIFNGQTFTDWDGDYANIPSWVPYDKTQNNNGDLHTTYQTWIIIQDTLCQASPALKHARVLCGVTNSSGIPREPCRRLLGPRVHGFNQSRNWGCDAYSVSLDTAYFLYDTPERFC